MTDIDATPAHGHQPGDPMELTFRVAALTAEVERLRDAYKCAHADRLARALERDRTIDEREHLKAEVERLERLAYTDPLTGLANRRALEAHLAERQASGEPYDIAFIDLDRFKAINDTYDHGIGDALIAAVATRLASTVTERFSSAFVARLSGDEFVVVGPSEFLGKCVAGVFAEPFDAGTPEALRMTASIGVCEAWPCDAWRQVLRGADIAARTAKRAGGDQVAIHGWATNLPAVPVRPKVRPRDERAGIAEVIA